MTCVIVPNHISDAINRALDAALAEHPLAAPDRDRFYSVLLDYFNEHGVVPEFSLERQVDA
jgi:hypothetical protein